MGYASATSVRPWRDPRALRPGAARRAAGEPGAPVGHDPGASGSHAIPCPTAGGAADLRPGGEFHGLGPVVDGGPARHLHLDGNRCLWPARNSRVDLRRRRSSGERDRSVGHPILRAPRRRRGSTGCHRHKRCERDPFPDPAGVPVSAVRYRRRRLAPRSADRHRLPTHPDRVFGSARGQPLVQAQLSCSPPRPASRSID